MPTEPDVLLRALLNGGKPFPEIQIAAGSERGGAGHVPAWCGRPTARAAAGEGRPVI